MSYYEHNKNKHFFIDLFTLLTVAMETINDNKKKI